MTRAVFCKGNPISHLVTHNEPCFTITSTRINEKVVSVQRTGDLQKCYYLRISLDDDFEQSILQELGESTVSLHIGGFEIYKLSFKFIYFISQYTDTKIYYCDMAELEKEQAVLNQEPELDLYGMPRDLGLDNTSDLSEIFKHANGDSDGKYLMIPLMDQFILRNTELSLISLPYHHVQFAFNFSTKSKMKWAELVYLDYYLNTEPRRLAASCKICIPSLSVHDYDTENVCGHGGKFVSVTFSTEDKLIDIRISSPEIISMKINNSLTFDRTNFTVVPAMHSVTWFTPVDPSLSMKEWYDLYLSESSNLLDAFHHTGTDKKNIILHSTTKFLTMSIENIELKLTEYQKSDIKVAIQIWCDQSIVMQDGMALKRTFDFYKTLEWMEPRLSPLERYLKN